MSKCLAIKTGENTLEPTAQTNNTLNAIKLAVLQKQAMQGLGFNTKEYITESGTYTAPVTGVYRITAIAGGSGSRFVESNKGAYSGKPGNRITEFVNLNKGDIIPVTIGAGGIGTLTDGADGLFAGGKTTFGDISTDDVNNQNLTTYPYCTWGFGQLNVSFRLAYGPNAKLPIWTTDGDNDGANFGGGAGVSYSSNPALSNRVGNGFQGCVIVEYFDPEKASLPAINDTDLIPYLTLLQRLDTLEKQFAENVVYNDKIIITESGNFEVPVTGWYKATCIAGGWGGSYQGTFDLFVLRGGRSGITVEDFIFLEKGQEVPVVIGAGGSHGEYNPAVNPTLSGIIAGGQTSFGSVVAPQIVTFPSKYFAGDIKIGTKSNAVYANGGGLGNGYAAASQYYGAGGSADFDIQPSNHFTTYPGIQGCVILQLHNPNKNQGV